MEKQGSDLVFNHDEYQVVAGMASSYLAVNVEELSAEDCASLRELRNAATGRLVAQLEDLFEFEGIFYTERKQSLITTLQEDQSSDPLTGLMLDGLESLPEDAREAMTLRVPNTELVRNCIRWASENITLQNEDIAEVVDNSPDAIKQDVAEEISASGMQITGWAYDLGLREIEL